MTKRTSRLAVAVAVAGLLLGAPCTASAASSTTNEQIFIGGIVTFSVSYGLTVIGSAVGVAIGATADDPVCMDSAGWGFLPLVGSLVGAVTWPNYQKYDASGQANCADWTGTVLAVGIADSAVQITGAALAIAGLALEGGGRGRGALTVEPMPVAGGVGVQLVWRGL